MKGKGTTGGVDSTVTATSLCKRVHTLVNGGGGGGRDPRRVQHVGCEESVGMCGRGERGHLQTPNTDVQAQAQSQSATHNGLLQLALGTRGCQGFTCGSPSKLRHTPKAHGALDEARGGGGRRRRGCVVCVEGGGGRGEGRGKGVRGGNGWM